MLAASRIESIIRSVRELSGPIRVHGAPPSVTALILARLALARCSFVVIAKDEDRAEELAADIETLGKAVLSTPLEVRHFPSWEQSLYSPIAPSLRIRIERARVLAALAAPTPPSIIVTTIAGLCQATTPRAEFEKRRLSLTINQSIVSRDKLATTLIENGYLRNDNVEDRGSFAVRGDIVDIFPPDRPKPIRVELFGDVIERLREFDPESQRALASAQDIQSLSIPPAREVLVNSDTCTTLREHLKAHADDAGVSRGIRDPILEQVREGIYADHSDAWAPFAYSNPATLLDYLPNDTFFVWDDELGITQAWDAFIADQKRLAADNSSGVIVPAPEKLFLWSENAEPHCKQRSRLFLDQLAIADLSTVERSAEEEPSAASDTPSKEDDNAPKERHEVRAKTNTDLASGTKHSLGELQSKFELWTNQGFSVLVLASTESQLERIRFLLEERGFACHKSVPPAPKQITLALGSLASGFRWPTEGLVIVVEDEILGSKRVKRRKRFSSEESAARQWSGLQALSDLAVGDAVVHVDHGIGRYQGLVRLDLSGAPSDFLALEYANRDKLYLPVYRLNVIQKYAGGGDVALDRLGSQHFSKTKEKVRDAVRKLAVDLVKLYAERSIRPGIQFSQRDAVFREFEAKFPYEETQDQLKAIDDTLADLESGKIMDRLICGDVGYGKTEVAIRAAFRAVCDGKQVALLVPTTILAQQHEETFRARLKDYPISIGSLSRFKTQKQQKDTVAALEAGKLDIVIGTHRLLSRDIKFHELGLLIVDEEHRFGVEHKERLKALKVNTHVLTLTATPIPRTLHMALSGLRDISIINTAPIDRLPIRTYVSKFDEVLIKRAIELELSRGGQVFFLHNRVQTIENMAEKLRALLPQAKVAVGHGQMTEGALEKTMLDFYHKRSQILVCTSIIESGLDLPSANTIIINRADTFGLAQLYQIRGRVGRSQSRAYAYLLLPEEGAITEDAKKRLEVIQRFVELGSGFSIASHDLEIRGGGDLLGPQQSGNIAAVGFDLYTELLEEAIRELRGQPQSVEDARNEPEIKIPFPAFLSEEYVPDVHQRLSLYRRFSAAALEADIVSLEEELRDRFGPLPPEALNLLWLIRIKQLLKTTGVDSLTVGPEKVSFISRTGSKLDPARAIALVSAHPHRFQFAPDSKFVARMPTGSLRDLFFALEELFKNLSPRTA